MLYCSMMGKNYSLVLKYLHPSHDHDAADGDDGDGHDHDAADGDDGDGHDHDADIGDDGVLSWPL